jgi:hypothetical protein
MKISALAHSLGEICARPVVVLGVTLMTEDQNSLDQLDRMATGQPSRDGSRGMQASEPRAPSDLVDPSLRKTRRVRAVTPRGRGRVRAPGKQRSHRRGVRSKL